MIRCSCLLFSLCLAGCSLPGWLTFHSDETAESRDVPKYPGYCYQQFQEGDYSRAFVSCTGIKEAQAYYNLAYMYTRGLGTEVNYYVAFYLLQQASSAGHPDAMYELGRRYDQGKGCRRNYQKALYWYRKAADMGQLPAMNALASLYYCGDGIKQDPTAAIFWYYKTAQRGDPVGMYNVGLLLSRGVTRAGISPEDPLFWYRKAATAGNPDARFELARSRFTGKEKDPALREIKSSAEDGSLQASFFLGNYYSADNRIKRYPGKWFCWYYLASLQGSSQALYRLQDLTAGWSEEKFEQVKESCEKQTDI
ncbi:MAG: tetratricopeptide repeat protein [Succinivibrionaceae bacterium]